jgi:DNA-binding helix-hairpin-helix protein with protein kinase domain
MSSFTPRRDLTIYRADGRPLVLEQEIGKGGEGSVWSVAGNPNSVAKFYHQGLDPQKAKKLEAMCRLKSESLLRIAAWPTDVLRAVAFGQPQGLLMPRIKGYQEAHLLYSPKSRRGSFPEAQLPFILHSAVNVARAFATVHDAGQVIGDVNHANLLISRDAMVALIDCDSFEISDGQNWFACPVGVSTYTPPELQGKSFQGVRRTQQHDAFGLAVLIFHMLFLGRHPFSGIFRQGNGDKTIEDAIREFRFAYSPDESLTEMDQPPWVPRLSTYPSDVGALFMRAFGREGASGKRPIAHEWIPVLQGVSGNLKRCAANDSHHYFQGLSSCPWCTVEKAAGIPMFGFTVLRTPDFDIVAIWAQIESVRPDENGAPQFANAYVDQCKPDPRIEEIRKERRKKRALSIGSILIAVIVVIPGLIPAMGSIGILIAGLAVMMGLWRQGDSGGTEFERERKNTLRSFEAASSRWNNVQKVPDAFAETKKRLEAQKQEFVQLPSVRVARMAQLQAELRRKQLVRFLEKHRIDDATIPGIKQGRKTLLRAYGIEDASDLHPGLAIKGFGSVLKSALWQWRMSIEQRFVFNPNEGVDPADIRVLDMDLVQKNTALIKSLSSGPQALKQVLLPWQVERSSALANLNYWTKAVAQAAVNIHELGRF